MKAVIFDLGGVVLSRDKKQCSNDLVAFLDIIHSMPTPTFWLEFDRGALTWEEVVRIISDTMKLPYSRCDEILHEAIAQTYPAPSTCQLIEDLKRRGAKIYALSNMSFEFINAFHKFPIFRQFDGEIISCHCNLIKPERAIYELAASKFGIVPAETLFIDDKPVNTHAAADFGFKVFDFDRNNPELSCNELRKMLLEESL